MSIQSPRAFATIAILRAVISTDLTTTSGKTVYYILMLPVCKLEMWVKRQLLGQVDNDFQTWVTPG